MKRLLLIATLALCLGLTLEASDQKPKSRRPHKPHKAIHMTQAPLVMPEALKPGDKIAIISIPMLAPSRRGLPTCAGHSTTPRSRPSCAREAATARLCCSTR